MRAVTGPWETYKCLVGRKLLSNITCAVLVFLIVVVRFWAAATELLAAVILFLVALIVLLAAVILKTHMLWALGNL